MEQKGNNKDVFWKALSVILLVILVGVVAFSAWQAKQPRHIYYERGGSQSQSEMAALVPGLEVDHESIYWVADLAELALPFVVHVETVYGADDDEAVKNLHEEWQQNMPEFHREFRDFQFEMPDVPEDFEMPHGEGSGFIIREDGYIVTNAHVVNGAAKFLVHMYDGTTLDAELIGADNFKDIAVLKVSNGDMLPVAVLGNSAETRIGEPVVAIGSPLGFEATVTAGIVSSNYRDPEDVNRRADIRRPQYLIQTDAAINQGNSGGPLLNADGEVIGVNQAIMRWEQGGMFGGPNYVPVEGIGFAIPIDEVKATIEQIVQEGRVIYPGISATITSVDQYLEREPNLELAVDHGVYVVSLTIDGPADRAGIEAGDVILSIDGEELQSADELIEEIQRYKVGDRVILRMARQGGEKQEEVTVVLGELDISAITVE